MVIIKLRHYKIFFYILYLKKYEFESQIMWNILLESLTFHVFFTKKYSYGLIIFSVFET